MGRRWPCSPATKRGWRGREGEIKAADGEALPIPTDVADPGQVEAAADRAERELGPVDVWVNDAIAVIFSPFKAEPEGRAGVGAFARAGSRKKVE